MWSYPSMSSSLHDTSIVERCRSVSSFHVDEVDLCRYTTTTRHDVYRFTAISLHSVSFHDTIDLCRYTMCRGTITTRCVSCNEHSLSYRVTMTRHDHDDEGLSCTLCRYTTRCITRTSRETRHEIY